MLAAGCGPKRQPATTPVPPPPPALVVLLPDPGTQNTGRARVSNEFGATDLSTARAATRVTASAAPAAGDDAERSGGHAPLRRGAGGAAAGAAALHAAVPLRVGRADEQSAALIPAILTRGEGARRSRSRRRRAHRHDGRRQVERRARTEARRDRAHAFSSRRGCRRRPSTSRRTARRTAASRPATTCPSRATAASRSRSGSPRGLRLARDPRRLILLSGIAPVLVTAALALYRPAAFARLEDAAYDVVLRMAGTRHARSRRGDRGRGRAEPGIGRPVAVAARRRRRIDHAAARRRRVRDRARHHVRRNPTSTRCLEPARLRRRRRRTRNSRARSATRRSSSATASSSTGAAPAKRPCVLHPAPAGDRRRPPGAAAHAPMFQAPGAVCNLPVIAEAARPDRASSTPRRIATAFSARAAARGVRRRVYPSLALSAVAAAQGVTHLALHVSNVNASSLSIGERTVPLDGRSNLLLGYRGQEADVSVSLRRRRHGRQGRGRMPSAARSCSWARPRSARAKSWRRRSTRSLSASKCRRPRRTTCCSRISSIGPRSARRSTALVVIGVGIAMAALLAWTGVVGGLLGGRRRHHRRCGGARHRCSPAAACSSRRCCRRSASWQAWRR